jgi:hypothetical protein
MTEDELQAIEARLSTMQSDPDDAWLGDVDRTAVLQVGQVRALAKEVRRLRGVLDLTRGALADIALMTPGEIADGVAQRKAKRIYDETMMK